MKKILLLSLLSINSLHCMNSTRSYKDRLNSLVTQGFYAVVAYNEKTKYLYPVCEFYQQRQCCCFYSTFFMLKDIDGNLVPYDRASHGELLLSEKGIVLKYVNADLFRNRASSWEIKAAFRIKDPDLKPLVHTNLKIEQHINESGQLIQGRVLIKEMKSVSKASKIATFAAVALGCGVYLAQQATL